jgi:hypothetical protein
MKIILLFLITSFLMIPNVFAGVKTFHDEFEGTTTYIMTDVHIRPDSFFDPTDIGINPQKIAHKDESVTYSILVNYDSDNWLFIEKGESLVMLVDGERIGFTGEGSTQFRSVVSGGLITEMAFYLTDAKTIRKIANAEEVKIKLVGRQKATTAKFRKSHIKAYKKFVKKYIDIEKD